MYTNKKNYFTLLHGQTLINCAFYSEYLRMFMSREQRIRELKLNLNPCISSKLNEDYFVE